MLVLTRKLDEKILIPGINTAITLVETRAGVVRLGIEAPKQVVVVREEIAPADMQKGEFLIAKGQVESLGKDILIAKEQAHAFKNRLNSGTIGLGLIRRQIERGVAPETILATIEKIVKGMSIEEAVKTTCPQAACRALLVEDDENERVLLAGLLEMAGIEVQSVEDGDDALAYLKGHLNDVPDVILLDLNMPRMNGADFARAVKDQGVRSKIFMVTGSEPPARVPPVDLWIRKPLNPDRLLKELGQLCHAG